MTEDVRRQVMVHLAERRWRQADLVRASGIDKNTISTFLTGKSKPSRVTLARIEAALDLTPGTLAAIGEDPEPADSPGDRGRGAPSLREATDEELLAELGYRMVQLRRDAELAGVEAGNVTDFPAGSHAHGTRVRDLKRQRMLKGGQPVDQAADGRGETSNEQDPDDGERGEE